MIATVEQHQSDTRGITIPPGSVVTIRGVVGRHFSHEASMDRLSVPHLSTVGRAIGSNVADNRNKAVAGMEGDWLMMVDDDQVVLPQTLDILLDALYGGPFDVVSALICERQPPFWPHAYRIVDDKRCRLLSWKGMGTVEVDEFGAGLIVVRRRVFDRLAKPWFRLGEIESDQMGEDLGFCRRARKAGFRLAVVGQAAVGHVGYFAVWPDVETGSAILAAGSGETIGVMPPTDDVAILKRPELMGL